MFVRSVSLIVIIVFSIAVGAFIRELYLQKQKKIEINENTQNSE